MILYVFISIGNDEYETAWNEYLRNKEECRTLRHSSLYAIFDMAQQQYHGKFTCPGENVSFGGCDVPAQRECHLAVVFSIGILSKDMWTPTRIVEGAGSNPVCSTQNQSKRLVFSFIPWYSILTLPWKTNACTVLTFHPATRSNSSSRNMSTYTISSVFHSKPAFTPVEIPSKAA